MCPSSSIPVPPEGVYIKLLFNYEGSVWEGHTVSPLNIATNSKEKLSGGGGGSIGVMFPFPVLYYVHPSPFY